MAKATLVVAGLILFLEGANPMTSRRYHLRRLQGLLVAVLLSLAACRPAPPPAATPEVDTSPAIAADAAPFLGPEAEITARQTWTILVALKDTYNPETDEHGDLYQEQVWAGAKAAATDFGVDVELLGNPCHTCVEDQIRNLDARLAQGDIDGLMIMVTDSVRLARVVEKAVANGIPVVAMDTPVNTDDLLSFVVFDNVAGGRVMGEWVVKQLGGRGRVLLLDGALEQQNALDRKEGFLAGLETGDIEILDTQTAHWSDTEAATIVTTWLQTHQEIDAIIAANYAMAQGAYQALRAAGRDDTVLVTGFDAMPPALAAIANGELAATIDQTPGRQARLAVQLLVRHLENGETFPPRLVLPEIPLIDATNIADYK